MHLAPSLSKRSKVVSRRVTYPPKWSEHQNYRTEVSSCQVHNDCPAPMVCLDSSCVYLSAKGDFCDTNEECAIAYLPPLDAPSPFTKNNDSITSQNQTELWLYLIKSNLTRLRRRSDIDACGMECSVDAHCGLRKSPGVGCCRGLPLASPCSLDLERQLNRQLCKDGLECRTPLPSDSALLQSSSASLNQGAMCLQAKGSENWLLGLLLTALAAILINAGLNIHKLSYRRNEARPEHLRHPPHLQVLWLFGFVVWVIGLISNMAAFSFASQSMVTACGAISLASNAILAPLLNKEPFGWSDLVSNGLMVGGSITSVFFSSHADSTYSLCSLIAFYKRPAAICFLVIVSLCIVGLALVIYKFQRIQARRRRLSRESQTQQSSNESSSSPQTPLPPEASVLDIADMGSPKTPQLHRSNSFLLCCSGSKRHKSLSSTENTSVPVTSNSSPSSKPSSQNNESAHSTKRDTLQPEDHKKDSENDEKEKKDEDEDDEGEVSEHIGLLSARASYAPTPTDVLPESKIEHWVMPYALATQAALLCGLTTMFAKSASALITRTIEGDNQMNHIESILIVMVVIVTGIGQTVYIQMGLIKYDVALQVPVFFSVSTLAGLFSAGVYFGDFNEFKLYQWIGFCFGVLQTFLGVLLLSRRLKDRSMQTNLPSPTTIYANLPPDQEEEEDDDEPASLESESVSSTYTETGDEERIQTDDSEI